MRTDMIGEVSVTSQSSTVQSIITPYNRFFIRLVTQNAKKNHLNADAASHIQTQVVTSHLRFLFVDFRSPVRHNSSAVDHLHSRDWRCFLPDVTSQIKHLSICALIKRNYL